MIKVSFIIPALNEEKYIEKTLKSIVCQTIPRKEYEIIVSDGKSVDKTLQVSKEYADVIISQKNKSISQARNLGAKKAKGDYLIFVDADTKVGKTLAENVIKVFDENKKIVGAFVNYKFSTKSVLIIALNTLFNILDFIANIILPKSTIVAGVCLIARAKTFFKIGGFDEDMRTSEDNDLANRLRKKGDFIFIREDVYTSDRRLKKMGLFGMLKYYLNDAFNHYINKDYKGEYIPSNKASVLKK